MTERRFDVLTRNLAGAGATRRRWLRTVAAMLTAAHFASDHHESSASGPQRTRKAHHGPGARKEQRNGQRQRRRRQNVIAAGWPCASDDRCAPGTSCVQPNSDVWTGYCTPDAVGAECAVVTEACEVGGRPCCGDLECRMAPGGQSLCLPPAKLAGARCSRATECQGGRCHKGRCRCAAGLVSCGGECVDVATDPRHCGDCGSVCGEGEFCFQGVCSVGGGAGWGWGGTACSFPTDQGICLGWPLWSVAEEPTRLHDVSRRGVSCELTTSDFRCPLCAFGGIRSHCGAMPDPTREQVLRHCKPAGTDIRIVSCQAGNCLPDETLCTHWCRRFDTRCPQEKGSIVPSVEVCTTRPDIYCTDPIPEA